MVTVEPLLLAGPAWTAVKEAGSYSDAVVIADVVAGFFGDLQQYLNDLGVLSSTETFSLAPYEAAQLPTLCKNVFKPSHANRSISRRGFE